VVRESKKGSYFDGVDCVCIVSTLQNLGCLFISLN